MGKVKEAWMKIQTAKQIDDDIHRCCVAEIEDKVSALTDLIDCDDIAGNLLMSYILANIDDIADVLAEKGAKRGIQK
jgi:hypothetical protein